MLDLTTRAGLSRGDRAQRLSMAGRWLSRYALVVVLGWIGGGKFVKMEAHKLIRDSPLMSWFYDVVSMNTVAYTLGTLEILAAVLIGLRPFWPYLSAAGSALAVVLFLGTLSFLFTSSGVVLAIRPFPVLSGNPGQFLLKDLVLMGVALWTLGDSLEAAGAQSCEAQLWRAPRRCQRLRRKTP
jgi:uncharacterized membrane protein YkgB